MINTQYKLIAPMMIEPSYSNIDLAQDGAILVRPTQLSICKADLRYYFGKRNVKTLKERLPMCLIHEAVGVVLYDSTGTYQKKTKVVCLPNIPGSDGIYSENYRLDSLFRSSRADGFMQEMLCLSPAEVIPYDNIDSHLASITEFISVGVHAVHFFMSKAHTRVRRIAVWGDGPLSYIVTSILKEQLPDAYITVIGINPVKLQYFNFADEVLTVNEVETKPVYDHAFECVGGQASGNALKQITDTILPEGCVIILGVSEEPVPIETRMILEKCLTLVGRSRSRKEDFISAIDMLMCNERFSSRLSLIISDTISVHQVNDIYVAFEAAENANFKIVMDWGV